MQNTGTKFAGRIVSEGSTAKTLKSAAGEEAVARMNNLQRQDGIFGESWIDSPQISILMESKIDVQELIELHLASSFLFSGEKPYHQHHSSSLTMRKAAVAIRCYKQVYQRGCTSLDRLRRLVPRTAQRRIPSPENVSAIIGVLTAKPSEKDEKFAQSRTRSWIHSSNALQDVRRLWQCWKSTTQISTHVKVPCGKQR